LSGFVVDPEEIVFAAVRFENQEEMDQSWLERRITING
jgi:hypothetical protein